MALVIADRVRETSTTTGTGNFTLGGAVSGFESFLSAVGEGNTCYYTIAGGTEWEVGLGTITSGELVRTTVLKSSNSDAAVNFSAGTKDVFVTYPGDKAVYKDGNDSVVISTNSTSDALRITQIGTGNALVVEDSTNPDSTPFVVDTNGREILGHTTAIQIGTVTPKIQIHENTSSASQSIANWSASGTGPLFVFAKSRGSIGTNSIASSGDNLFEIRAYGDDGSAFVEAARITSSVDGTPGTNDMPGRLVFSTTADGASSPTERMRIDNQGRVGIGSTAITGSGLRLAVAATGSTNWNGLLNSPQIASDVTSNYAGFASFPTTAAATFTLASLTHFNANPSTFGAGSTVTNQYGFAAQSSLTGATNNYGFYSNLASGTGRWNFYANGTAANYFGGLTQFNQATQEKQTAIGASDINLTLGNYFTKTISGATTFTVSNTAASGLVSAFVLDLTNGGSSTVTWFANVKWPGGAAPTLTAAGRDVLGFFTHDGGTTWNAFVLGLDVK